MALDRQTIEKKDFPIARRGYDPEAVDAHLQRLAAEVERLQRESAAGSAAVTSSSVSGEVPAERSSPASIAIAASESVRMIVEAAESSAAGIESGAREEAAHIRQEAEADARRTRADAIAKSQGQVGAVGEASSLMLQRVDAMENEIGTLVESLRAGAGQLGADLSLLQGNMSELYDAAGSGSGSGSGAGSAGSAPEAGSGTPIGAGDASDRELPPIPEAAPDPSPHEEAPVVPPGLFTATEPDGPASDGPETEETSADGTDADVPAAGEDDVDGARLIALNMALNGASRKETDVYLRDNFDLPDRAALVEEAFATVEEG